MHRGSEPQIAVNSNSVRDEDVYVRDEVVLRPVFHSDRVAVLVLGRHDVEDVQHGRAVDEQRRRGEVAPRTDPNPKEHQGP